MKKVFGILLFAALIFTAQDGLAQSFKTGHINRDDIIMGMADYDTAMKKYNACDQELTNALELMQVELNNKYDQFTKEEKNLTDLVKANRAQEITDMQTRISNFQQQAQVQLQEKQAELLNPIIEKANNAINAVAKEGGYIYIYDVRTLVYVDTVKSTDIGPLVKTKLGIK